MRLKIIALFILVGGPTFGQEKCVCCTYKSIDNRKNFEKFFTPRTIASSKTKSAQVYSIQIDNDDSVRYLQARFKFNSRGYVIERKRYNRGGKPHSIYLYERNKYDLITKITFNYLDSLENISKTSSPDITDLEYDKNGRLVKLKERSYKGIILPDGKSHYSTFKYDSKNRLAKEYRYSYYEGSDTEVYETSFTYNSEPQINLSITKINGEPWLKCETKMDNRNRPIHVIQTGLPENNLAWNEFFKYDEKGNLINYQVESGPASFDECPEQGRFSEEYTFEDTGLLNQIDHLYENIRCRMIITYK